MASPAQKTLTVPPPGVENDAYLSQEAINYYWRIPQLVKESYPGGIPQAKHNDEYPSYFTIPIQNSSRLQDPAYWREREWQARTELPYQDFTVWLQAATVQILSEAAEKWRALQPPPFHPYRRGNSDPQKKRKPSTSTHVTQDHDQEYPRNPPPAPRPNLWLPLLETNKENFPTPETTCQDTSFIRMKGKGKGRAARHCYRKREDLTDLDTDALRQGSLNDINSANVPFDPHWFEEYKRENPEFYQ
jgi:hypothetical protein